MILCLVWCFLMYQEIAIGHIGTAALHLFNKNLLRLQQSATSLSLLPTESKTRALYDFVFSLVFLNAPRNSNRSYWDSCLASVQQKFVKTATICNIFIFITN